MIWSKEKIVADLQKLVGAEGKITIEDNAQGEWYTRQIYILPNPRKGSDDGISISGFNDEHIQFSDVDNPKQDVPMVEISNFESDSDGGLGKFASPKIRKLYFIAVDYFKKQKSMSVVDYLKDYF